MTVPLPLPRATGTRAGYGDGMRPFASPDHPRATPSHRRRLAAVAAVGVLALAGCGDDADDLDERAELPEEGTEIIPGEEGPVD